MGIFWNSRIFWDGSYKSTNVYLYGINQCFLRYTKIEISSTISDGNIVKLEDLTKKLKTSPLDGK